MYSPSPLLSVCLSCLTAHRNAEGGVGIICTCLPTVNLVISKIRKYGSSANRSYGYHHDSNVPLSKMRNMGGSRNPPSKGSKRNPDGTIDFGNDQSHLISYAGAVDTGADSAGAGIHKTIDVSQTVEMLDERDEQDRNFSSQSHRNSP